MQTALLDYLLTNPVNDYTLSLMAKSFESQNNKPTMNYESATTEHYNPSFSLDTPSLDSAMFDPIDFATPMSIPQQSDPDSLFPEAPPDLWHDHAYDDIIMAGSAQFTSPPKIPFKPSSPYYSTSPAIHSDTTFFNALFPLTVSPQDAMLSHNDDDFPMQTAFHDLKDTQKLYPEFSAFGKPTAAPLAEFEEPEAMDEDEDDEDAEYDEVLVSSSDDDPDFDDDLYTQGPSTQPPLVPITAPIYPAPAGPMELPDTLHFHPLAPPSPSPLHDRNAFDPDNTKTARSKRIPISHAGPHRCDVVNPSTGKPCNKVFSRPYDLIRHQDTIHAPVRKTFKCDVCGEASKTFSRMDALSRHIRVKHSKA